MPGFVTATYKLGFECGAIQSGVALARALVAAPRILLLDEPLASLGSSLKERLIPYLMRIREEFQIPMIYVTHDHNEVAVLSCAAIVIERENIVSLSKA